MSLRRLISGLLLGVFITSSAQEVKNLQFVPPFDFPMLLSANFGELRSNHFHGGLDIKTQGQVGKPIHSIADGYVSRATVSEGGYGQAIYVIHPNGFTSVYGHVLKFDAPIEAEVEAYQYEHETFEADLYFPEGKYVYKAGDIIALSGNEGYSFGPHLHMEIRHTDTDEHIDPLPFYKEKIKDGIAPRASAFMIYPTPYQGVVNGSSRKKVFSFDKPAAISAWGKISAGIKAFDYMDGTSNNYGVHTVRLLVDTVEVFKSTVDAYLPYENRMINAWTDYAEYIKHNSWFMRSVILPGNTWRMLEANADNGYININEERPYRFKYILTDAYGNQRTYRFTVHGKKQSIPSEPPFRKVLKWWQGHVVQAPGMELILPRGVLYDDVCLQTKVLEDSLAISHTYRLHNEALPLHTSAFLYIGVRHYPVKDLSKYYVARVKGRKKYSVGGRFEEGWMRTSINQLGSYTVAVDTVAPRVTPLNEKAWRTGNIRFKLTDAETGIKDYKVKIDGKFVLFGYSAKNAILSNKSLERVAKKGKHVMELVVTDHCGNTLTREYTF